MVMDEVRRRRRAWAWETCGVLCVHTTCKLSPGGQAGCVRPLTAHPPHTRTHNDLPTGRQAALPRVPASTTYMHLPHPPTTHTHTCTAGRQAALPRVPASHRAAHSLPARVPPDLPLLGHLPGHGAHGWARPPVWCVCTRVFMCVWVSSCQICLYSATFPVTVIGRALRPCMRARMRGQWGGESRQICPYSATFPVTVSACVHVNARVRARMRGQWGVEGAVGGELPDLCLYPATDPVTACAPASMHHRSAHTSHRGSARAMITTTFFVLTPSLMRTTHTHRI